MGTATLGACVAASASCEHRQTSDPPLGEKCVPEGTRERVLSSTFVIASSGGPRHPSSKQRLVLHPLFLVGPSGTWGLACSLGVGSLVSPSSAPAWGAALGEWKPPCFQGHAHNTGPIRSPFSEG